MKGLNENEAYAATFFFIEQLYLETKSDYLGGLLGGMALLEDGKSADPAYLGMWRKAVERAKTDEHGNRFKLVTKDKNDS